MKNENILLFISLIKGVRGCFFQWNKDKKRKMKSENLKEKN